MRERVRSNMRLGVHFLKTINKKQISLHLFSHFSYFLFPHKNVTALACSLIFLSFQQSERCMRIINAYFYSVPSGPV